MDRFSIEQLEIEELEREIEIRKELLRKKNKPQEIKEKNWTLVIKYCLNYIDDLYEDGYVDSDLKQYIFEAAMQAVFGGNVWEWIRKQKGY